MNNKQIAETCRQQKEIAYYRRFKRYEDCTEQERTKGKLVRLGQLILIDSGDVNEKLES